MRAVMSTNIEHVWDQSFAASRSSVISNFYQYLQAKFSVANTYPYAAIKHCIRLR